ncbi:MAG: chromosomal replication initiator protein DnaA [Bacilli bacterium]|nr:chromosomal replication initiator protein DnaA [Bacilli bacterium]
MELTVSELTSLWDRTLSKIKIKIGDPIVYDSFFAESYIHSVQNNEIVVVVNSGLAATIIKMKYIDIVNSAINEVTGSDFEFIFVIESELSNLTAKKQTAKPEYFTDSVLNQNYTFKNFVVGPSNLEAYQASLMISQNPGNLYNPLFLYSESGLGKTHLLHAIGNAIKERYPALRVQYIHAQEFLDEYVKFVKGDKEGMSIVDWFKKSVDVLLIDDVQFLSNKKATEETFFSIYNNFYAANKQVILTSDQHPSKLQDLDERLKTRFTQGLAVEINTPERLTCESILKMKIQLSDGLEVKDFDEDVISFIAERFGRNIRELEGALARLLFYVINIKPTKHIDLQIAMEAVKSLTNIQDEQAKLSEKKITETVASYYGLTPFQLMSKVRTAQITMARHISMYLIRMMLDIPLIKIGSYFGGRDHTTVMNGVKKVEDELKTNKELQKAIEDLKNKLK